MKIAIFRLALVSLFVLLTIPITDCTKKEEVNNSDIVIVDIKQESDWDYWVTCKDGDYFFMKETNSKPSNVLLHIEKTNADIPFFFNQEGLPEKVIIGDYVFVFKNYSGYNVDFAVIYPDGKIEVAESIKTDVDWDQFKTKNGTGNIAVSDLIRWAGRVVGAIPCVLSLGSTAVAPIAVPLAAIACGNYLLNYLVVGKASELEKTFGLTDLPQSWQYFRIITNCSSPDILGCSLSFVTAGISSFADFVETLENDSVKISEANTLLFRGSIVFNPGLTYGTLLDVDGNIYKTIQIGSQDWMAENLKTTRYNDNTGIPLVNSSTDWLTLTAPGYCWGTGTAITRATYGAFYDWYALDALSTGGKNVCPTGWHVPSDAEWTTLTNYLGGEGVANNKLKETGTGHWASAFSTDKVTNESGFTALPGGFRNSAGFYGLFGLIGYYWSSSETDYNQAWFRALDWTSLSVSRMSEPKNFGYSVRCLKD